MVQTILSQPNTTRGDQNIVKFCSDSAPPCRTFDEKNLSFFCRLATARAIQMRLTTAKPAIRETDSCG